MKKASVKRLQYNWHQTGNLSDGIGENYSEYEVGRRGVTEIIEYKPKQESDVWYFDISLDTGTVFRVFNPNYVEYNRVG